ncbi:hypothetical protein AYO41_04965 [Verrucomicrobia bacterium SCGC AG-212-E04]|nr:hypothetical protein AYO41_04965 [Verrucomicrobia bacterium SCGC AG-212-E04]
MTIHSVSKEFHRLKAGGIILRRFHETDAEILYDLEADPVVKRFLGVVSTPRDEWVSRLKKSPLSGWTLATKSGEVVGRADLTDPIDPLLLAHLADRGEYFPDADLQIVLRRGYSGKRIGTQVAELLIRAAFQVAKYPFVTAVVHPENAGSLRLIKNSASYQTVLSNSNVAKRGIDGSSCIARSGFRQLPRCEGRQAYPSATQRSQ